MFKSWTVKTILIIILVHIPIPIIFALGHYYEDVLHCDPTTVSACGRPMYSLLYFLGLLSWLFMLISVPASIIGLISSIIYDLVKFIKSSIKLERK